MITRDSKAAIPVLDPTQGKQPQTTTLSQQCWSCFFPLTE